MDHPLGIKALTANEVSLFVAVRSGSVRDVEELLAKGCDPNIRDSQTGNTPLRLAAGLNRLSVTKLLLEAGVDPNVGNVLASIPIHLAVSALQDRHGVERPRNLRLAELLLTYGADSHARDFEGKSIMDFAAEPAKVAALLKRRLSKQLPVAGAELREQKRL